MIDDHILSGLIDANRLARETYHVRNRQELLAKRQGLTVLDAYQRSKTAEASWKAAEAALWQYRATH